MMNVHQRVALTHYVGMRIGLAKNSYETFHASISSGEGDANVFHNSYLTPGARIFDQS